MCITIFRMIDEGGRDLFFVDQRNKAGELVACELFYTLSDAEAYFGSIGGVR